MADNKKQTKQQPQQKSLCQLGIVTSQDKKNYRVKVRLNLSGNETDFIRVGSFFAGPGWGFKWLPAVGTEVKVDFPEGDLNEGVVSCCFYSDEADRPPDEENEPCFIHETGSKLVFKSNGDILLEAKGKLGMKGAKLYFN